MDKAIHTPGILHKLLLSRLLLQIEAAIKMLLSKGVPTFVNKKLVFF